MAQGNIFKTYSEAYDKVLRYTKAHMAMLNLAMHYLHGRKRVLNLCSGTGLLEERFIGLDARIVSMELEPDMLQYAQSKFLDEENIHTAQGDAHTLPYGKAEFDGAAIINGLYCVEDPKKVLRSVRRVIKPGSPLIITGPLKGADFGIISSKMRQHFTNTGMLDYLDKYQEIVEHANGVLLSDNKNHFFDIDEVENLLEEVGFNDIKASRNDLYYGNAYFVVAV